MPFQVDWNAPIPEQPVFAFVDQAIAHFGDRPAIDFLGKRYTYRQLGDLIARAAKGFQNVGVRKGVKVGLCLPNTPYHVICYHAILKAGGTVVNFNPLYVEKELSGQIRDSETTMMVTLDLKQIYPKVAAVAEQSGLQKIIVCPMSGCLPAVKSLLFSVLKRSEMADWPKDSRHLGWNDFIDNDGEYLPPDIDLKTDIAVLQYTGGTTGTPKGAMLTHWNITANTEQCRRVFSKCEPGKERFLCVLPFFHVFGMTATMNLGLAWGSELILLPRFELAQVMKCIAKTRPTVIPGVPTMYTAISQAAEQSSIDMTSVKFCISGGAPLPVEVRTRFEKLTGCKLVEGYGLSEAAPVTHCNPLEGEVKTGSIGIALPLIEVSVRDPLEFSREMPLGEKGELCVRGPNVMAGYWRRPDETANTIQDGWLRTGDIGYLDAEGYVFLVDRIKDVIICGGYNVYPRMVEEAIYQHPAVAEVVVIGVDDEYRGQAPKAFIRLKDGQSVNEAEIKAFLGEHLSRIEMPKAVEFRAELPKTMVGKLSKKELVEEEKAKAEARKSDIRAVS